MRVKLIGAVKCFSCPVGSKMENDLILPLKANGWRTCGRSSLERSIVRSPGSTYIHSISYPAYGEEPKVTGVLKERRQGIGMLAESDVFEW